jgi:capsular polysaccharide biosynthesis protein
MKHELTGLDILNIVIRKRKIFYIAGLLSIVISTAVAFLLPVYYKSTSVVYPYNPEAYDPRNIRNATNPYGSTLDGDRIMAVAESRDVKMFIIKKYNMMNRYKIDSTNKLAKVKLLEKFSDNLVVRENDLSAIEISFYDPSPDTAALIVNDIITLVDDINKKPLLEISQKIFLTSEQLINEKYHGIDTIQEIIEAVDFQNKFTRSEIIASELLEAILELNTARKNLDLIKQNFSTMNIIERAEPIAKKARPQRLLIVLGTLLGTMLITFIILFIKEFTILSLKESESNQ